MITLLMIVVLVVIAGLSYGLGWVDGRNQGRE